MAMIAMTTRSSMRVKPRERMIRSCGLPVRNGSLKRACDETGCSHLQPLERPPSPCRHRLGLGRRAGHLTRSKNLRPIFRPVSRSPVRQEKFLSFCWPFSFSSTGIFLATDTFKT